MTLARLFACALIFSSLPILHAASLETRSERIPVVQIHVGNDDLRSDVFTYTAPDGWEILDIHLHETGKGGDAKYNVTSRTSKEVKVSWSVHSKTVRGPFKMVVNTITAFLGLDMSVDLQKIPDPVTPPEKWPKVVAVASGLAFLVAILVIAIFIPHPSPFRLFVFRIILAIAAAGFGAALPGILNLRIAFIPKTIVEAGGALGLFVLIYLINPARLAASNSEPKDK